MASITVKTSTGADALRSSEFEGAVILITGAASGIGQTCARQFALNGCQSLFLVDLSRAQLEKTAKLIEGTDQLHPQIELYECNVADESSVRTMVQRCVAVYGKIDIACNNAGVLSKAVRTHEATIKDYDFVCQVLLCEKYELEQMLHQAHSPTYSSALFGSAHRSSFVRGSIVNTASIGAHCIIPTASAYNASKHAVVALTRTDALRHIQDGVRINCVSPGPVGTPMLSGSGLTDEVFELTKRMAPMHRVAEPLEIAHAILFLAGPRASAISGVNLPVDCGNQLIRSI